MQGVQWAPAPLLSCQSSQAVSRSPAYGGQTEGTALRYGPLAAVTLTGCSAESAPSELDMRYAGRLNQLTAAVPEKRSPVSSTQPGVSLYQRLKQATMIDAAVLISRFCHEHGSSQQEAWLGKEVHTAGLICPDAEQAVLEQKQAVLWLKHMG
ncbi:Uncharacterized protein DAT39_005582 [Clarias magur]|uniref:Uncharacterized protein n=1 Tax=Clarias magur TaxID=1594786 RepID=A0A8J4UQW7_CLAMG|nr:Uncharacterized protein DAT39_005582 [Clarias magur]